MATIQKGILGPVNGLVGTVVGATWRGISYIRSKPIRSKNKRYTTAQLEQQEKFKLISAPVAAMSDLFSVTFRKYARGKSSPYNQAQSYNLTHAISGTYPGFAIDYSNFLVARGDLPNAGNPSAADTGNDTITFSWTNNAGSAGLAQGTDRAILVVYCPAMEQVVYTTGSALRSATTDVLDVSPFTRNTVQTWISFVSVTGEVATSVFTGEVSL